jgi:anti-sigma regulatory factor (Ser/Thr protein kinase)
MPSNISMILCFLNNIQAQSFAPKARPRTTTLPLQRIAQAQSHMWLRTTFIPWLSSRSGIPATALGEVQVCIAELFNNILDHSELDRGSIFIQHFPRESQDTIAVSDFGRGIPEAVRTIHPHLSDVEAIIKACEEGFTSQSNMRNRGAGLPYLMDIVTKMCGGKVTIYSLRGMVQFIGKD